MNTAEIHLLLGNGLTSERNAGVATLVGGASGGVAPALQVGLPSMFSNFNMVRNPAMLGAAAGSPGTFPDLWTGDTSDSGVHGVTFTNNGVITDGTYPCLSARSNGTYDGLGRGNHQMVVDRVICKPSEAQKLGFYLRLVAGAMTNITVNIFANTEDAAGNYLNTIGFAAQSVTGTGTLFETSFTTDATAFYVNYCIQIAYNTSAHDVTLAIGMPEAEVGSTLHHIRLGTPVVLNDGFFSRAIPNNMVIGHIENGSTMPSFVNGPPVKINRGRSFNPETRWNNTTNASSGVFNMTGFASVLAANVAAGITPIVVLYGGDVCPTFAGTSTNPNLAALQAWISQQISTVIATVGRGKVVFEGPNECDSATFYTGTKANLVAIQQYIYNAVKAADPTCPVIGPSITGQMSGIGYMRDLLALGIEAYYDVANFHSYNQSAHHIPELNWSVNNWHNQLYSRFIQGTKKPVWDSEGSFAANSNIPVVSDRVNYFFKQYVLTRGSGIERGSWYALDNTTFATEWDATNNFNDIATAEKIVNAWCVGATPAGPVSATGTVWSWGLTRSAGYSATIIWDTSGAGSYTVPAGITQMRDTSGNMYTVTLGAVIPLTSSPLLFESGNTLGQFITGYIVSPAQSGKTVWDTARDGALPGGGGYSSTAIAYNTPYTQYQAESLAIFAAFTTPPTTPRKALIDAVVAGLKADGVWGKLTSLQIYAAADSQAGLLDWANVSRSATVTAAPTFTIDRGFTTNGTSSYIDTGINPTTAVGSNGTTAAMTQNSASAGYWSLSAGQQSSSVYGWNGAGNGITIASRSATDFASYRLWNGSGIQATSTNTDGTGFLAINRSGSSASQLYKNGALVPTGAPAGSNAPVSANLRVGSSAAATFVAVQCAATFTGSTMTATDHGNLNTRLRTYMTAVGVP